MANIGLFPAAGKLGGSIAKHLMRIMNPEDLVLICRSPEKLPAEYTKAGATIRKADYDEPESLVHVFDDVTTLFLVSYPSIQHSHRFNVHKRAIDAARQSTPGVEHIFYSSLGFASGARRQSQAHVMQAHISTENYLDSLASASVRSKSLTWTSVREGIYSSTWPMYTGFPDLESPVLEATIPHDFNGSGVAWIKIDELGEASAQLIKQYTSGALEGEVENQILLLSGSKDWSLAETVRAIGALTGKEVKLKQVSVDEYVQLPAVIAQLSPHGPGNVPRQWATVFTAIREKEASEISPWVKRLLGREPENFEATVQAMLQK